MEGLSRSDRLPLPSPLRSGRENVSAAMTDLSGQSPLNELRLSTLLRLHEEKELSKQEICDLVLDTGLQLTASPIGFLGFISDDDPVMRVQSWSRNVLTQCATRLKPIEFYSADAGIIGEPVRNGQPLLLNDYSAPLPLKKGIPEGHLAIRRLLAVPHRHNGRVAALLTVGNKAAPYDDLDLEQLRLLLDGMWRIFLHREAEEKLVSNSWKIKRFANTIAHDLKSPAVSACGMARLLRERYRDVLDEKGERFCELIMRDAEQIALLAADINIYLSSQDRKWDLEALQLEELWETIRLEFASRFENQRVRWLEPDIETPRILGHKTGLLRALRNLVDNALKYGGDTLSRIAMGYQATGQHHILTVENDGRPIRRENEQVIFEEFIRRPDLPQVYGTGLGLAIVREIARRHRGEAWLSTTAEGKTVFFISIARRF